MYQLKGEADGQLYDGGTWSGAHENGAQRHEDGGHLGRCKGEKERPEPGDPVPLGGGAAVTVGGVEEEESAAAGKAAGAAGQLLGRRGYLAHHEECGACVWGGQG